MKLTGVLVVPETVTVVGGHSFQSTNLTGLVIKGNCEIKVNAFCNIYSLEFIYVEEGCNPTIGWVAFGYNEALTTAIFPGSIMAIDDDNFASCNKMVIYTTEGSAAQTFATNHFISVNTEDYDEQIKLFSDNY